MIESDLGARLVFTRLIMATFYFAAGVLHLVSPRGFVLIVPSFVPWPHFVVFATGICEIVGAIGLMTRRFRSAAGIGLAAYAVCVFPANINHAINGISVDGIPDTWWYHGPRLLAQPVLLWWALFAGQIINWPFNRNCAP